LFGDFAGTRRACSVDKDSLFISALKTAVTYKINKSNEISLHDVTNKIILQLVLPPIIPSPPQIPINPPVP